MSAELDDATLLSIDSETVFKLDDSGRMLHENDPEKSVGPRVCILKGELGALALVRHDVQSSTVARIDKVAATEPEGIDTAIAPFRVNQYLRALEDETSNQSCSEGVIFHVSMPNKFSQKFANINSGSPEGEALVANMNQNGMPRALIDLGFRGPEDFWPPWSLVTLDGAIVSIGFTARLGRTGAEAGIVTVPGERGRGYGPSAVASWASHPDLSGKSLFYSLKIENSASLRVAEKLGLRQIGTSLRIN